MTKKSEDISMKTEDAMTKKEDAMTKTEDAMTKTEDAMTKTEDAMTKTEDAMMKTEDAMMKKEDVMMKKEDVMTKTPWSYTSYNATSVSKALSEGKKVVLFFHAWRCPSCRSLDKEITAWISSLPANTIVFKVDYDASDDLKKKYGVKSQHTLVSLDKSENTISKNQWGDLGDLISMIK
jgi:thiol-disulfide isomerase/thioredoxin